MSKMSKKIAILYTGEPRTIYKTLDYLKNIILINDNYHVFGLLQNNDNNEEIENYIKSKINNNLKTLNWFDKNSVEWNDIQDKLLSEIEGVGQNWKNYLKNSGSMIEYYQMYLAFKDMEKYENENNIYYDYIFRIRTDNIITNSIYFDWIDYDFEYIKNYIYEIKNELKLESIINYQIISYFINSIYNKNRLKSLHYRTNFNWAKDYMLTDRLKDLLKHTDENDFLIDFFNYFKDEKYCIIFRTNNIYFMNRKNFQSIPNVGLTYGKYRMPDNEDHYWFNAESQFVKCLRTYNIDVFDSFTELEEKSIYQYNNSNYFDENNQLKTDLSDLMFFICRS